VPGNPPPAPPARGAGAAARRGRLLLPVAYLSLTVFFLWDVLGTGSALGIEDWDALLFQHASVLKSVLEYAQMPFWNPWYCGGNVLWQNPQVPILTPVYALAPFMSLSLAMKIGIAFYYLWGFAGMHLLLTRGFGLTAGGPLLFLASTFTLAGGIALHLATGHAAFLAYFHLPWLLWLFLAALNGGSLRAAAGAAAFLALCVWSGGVYIAVMSAVALCVLSAAAAAARRDWRPLALLGVVGTMACLLAAPKLLPVMLFTRDPGVVDIRNPPPGPDVMSPRMLSVSLLHPFQHRRMVVPGTKYGWNEYGNFIGGVSLLMVLAAAVQALVFRAHRREYWLGTALAVTTVMLLVISAGDFSRFAPYALLQRLPGITELRVPSRYLLVFTLFGTALAASALSGYERMLKGGSRLIPIALVIAALFVADRNRMMLAGAFPYAPIPRSLVPLSRPAAPRIDTATDGFAGDSPMLRGLFDGRAVVRCNEPLRLTGRLREDRPIVFAEGPVSLSRIAFSPNRIEFAVTARGPGGRVVMNQRVAAGWRSSAGPLQTDPGTGLAYVTVPAGADGHYAFSFFPPGFIAGWILWTAGVAATLLLWRRRI
jgi:hypothetical protein